MKLGLVLEGGASRTVFSCGVMDVLLSNKIYADYVIGTSAGIAYGTSYASKQIGRNREVAVKYMSDKRYMGMKHLLNPKNRSYYNLDFVFGDIPNKEVFFDFDAFSKFPGDVIATVTNLKTGQVEYMPVPAEDRNFTVLRASCALPIMFKPIPIGNEKYLDGGIGDPIPYKRALEDGCDKIIVILTREEGYIKEKDGSENFVKVIYKKHPELVKTLLDRPKIYNDSVTELEKLQKEGKALVIRPEKIQGVERTESNPEILESLYQQGITVGSKKIKEILEFIEK
ncbi:MAG: patatin family protein [Clostridia bacterium]|nr:patatin family protein [Clostridia bacterium]